MRVHIERDPREGSYRIWAWAQRQGESCMYEYRPTPNGMDFCLPDDGWTADGTLFDTPPTLTLPSEIAEALVGAFDPGLHPGNALSTHLADARSVRDRLLTMIETAATVTRP